jgi:hypothetical protein
VAGETSAIDIAARMAEVAIAFLDSLDPQLRELAWRPFPSDDERRRWYYTPTDHGGLPLELMRPAQQQRALKLVASGLSTSGYTTVAVIIGLENILDQLENWTRTWNRERGRDPGLYYLRIFGEPGGDTPWSWRFGGHHVSIHYLVLRRVVVATSPCFLGADPAWSPLLGAHVLRPLAAVEDLGRELVSALDYEQRARAVISSVAPVDLASANRSRLSGGELPLPLADVWRGRFVGDMAHLVDDIQRKAELTAGLRSEHIEAVRLTTVPKGIQASALTEPQKGMLRALLDAYVGRLPEELARIEADKYSGHQLDTHWFAWAGGIKPGEPHYYRIQGPRLLVEYDNTQRGTNHVHCVWRDLEGDFGDDVLLRHYAREHMSA